MFSPPFTRHIFPTQHFYFVYVPALWKKEKRERKKKENGPPETVLAGAMYSTWSAVRIIFPVEQNCNFTVTTSVTTSLISLWNKVDAKNCRLQVALIIIFEYYTYINGTTKK